MRRRGHEVRQAETLMTVNVVWKDVRSGEIRLLQALFGPKLAGVTVAGGLDAAIHTFAGTRPETTFKLAATTIALAGGSRVPAAIVSAARFSSNPARLSSTFAPRLATRPRRRSNRKSKRSPATSTITA